MHVFWERKKFMQLKICATFVTFGPNSKTCTCEVRAAWGRVSRGLTVVKHVTVQDSLVVCINTRVTFYFTTVFIIIHTGHYKWQTWDWPSCIPEQEECASRVCWICIFALESVIAFLTFSVLPLDWNVLVQNLSLRF